MERMHKVVCGIVFFTYFILGTRPAHALDGCPLTVRVLSPDGRQLETSISIREKNGRTIDRDQEDKDVAFCDLGILPVDVKVGSDGMCAQVTVHDVPLSLDRNYLLTVTYDPEACPEVMPEKVPTCDVLVRATDSSGHWLAGAQVNLPNLQGSPLKTDSYGRAEFFTKIGEVLHGTIQAHGFQTGSFDFKCSSSETIHEEDIELTKQVSE